MFGCRERKNQKGALIVFRTNGKMIMRNRNRKDQMADVCGECLHDSYPFEGCDCECHPTTPKSGYMEIYKSEIEEELCEQDRIR